LNRTDHGHHHAGGIHADHEQKHRTCVERLALTRGDRIQKQIIVSLTTWVAQRLDVTIKPIEPVVNTYGQARTNNRDALGWYDDEVVYLPTNLIREASGGALKETQIARILDEKGYLAKRESAKRLAVRYVPKVGKSQCYALSKERFGWGSDEEPEFTVYQGGRQ
jgi:hypothetical protein